jgi:hypothetical protein
MKERAYPQAARWRGVTCNSITCSFIRLYNKLFKKVSYKNKWISGKIEYKEVTVQDSPKHLLLRAYESVN